MIPDATLYRFGDLLALARRSWVLRMASELQARGFSDYKNSDAAAVRLLTAGPTPVGHLAPVLGVTRQAARKVAGGLEQRGYATIGPDPEDARKLNVTLTPTGRAYAEAITQVIATLNQGLTARVKPAHLAAADTVLRAAIDNDDLARVARRIPPPSRQPRPSDPPNPPRPSSPPGLGPV
jgi:DNA-binding MarR family transcriptional regulator